MSETNLKNLMITKVWHIPTSKKELFNAIVNQLNKLFPPIEISNWYFYESAWLTTDSDNFMDFSIKLVYRYILNNIDITKPRLEEYERLRTEFNKNVNKHIQNAPSILYNGDPFTIHIDILETDESGCLIEIECCPFLYYNITNFKTKINNMEKQNALLKCERFLKTLAVGLNAEEIDRTESDISKFTTFLGIGRNWMIATYALQLQEVSIILVAQKKGISLKREDVKKILDKKKIKDDEWGFDLRYKAFTKEVKSLYNIELSSLPRQLRKMRQEVFHEGHNPKEDETKLAISVTIALLKELKKVYEA